MAIKMADLPPGSRPRERLERNGLGALSDAELLALVVRSGGPGRSALDVATELLARHGSLALLATARVEELARMSSLGHAKASALAAAFELGRRAAACDDFGSPIVTPHDIVRIVIRNLADRRREEVFVVVTNSSAKATRVEHLTTGGIDRSLIPVRDVLAAVLRHDGVGFALAHTHPSGDPTPSEADIRVTENVAQGARPIGLTFLDHIVIAGTKWASLRALGHL